MLEGAADQGGRDTSQLCNSIDDWDVPMRNAKKQADKKLRGCLDIWTHRPKHAAVIHLYLAIKLLF